MFLRKWIYGKEFVKFSLSFLTVCKRFLYLKINSYSIVTNCSILISINKIKNILWKKRRFMPCPFTGLKMFCAGSNFLSQPKNLTAFSASSKTFVPAQKPILLNANHLFVWHKMFETATICKYIFGLAQKN